MNPPIKIPAAEINEFIESIGMPVINTVEQVPGTKVIPIPIKIPPIIARRIIVLSFGKRNMNSLLSFEEKNEPIITPKLTMNAKRNAVSAPSFPNMPIRGRKLLPPIQNLLMIRYIHTFNTAKILTQNK